MFCLDWYYLSKRKTKQHRENVDYHNELLQLHYSLENLQTLREFKEKENEDYQESLNDEELQKKLRKWKNGDKPPSFFESLFNDLFSKYKNSN